MSLTGGQAGPGPAHEIRSRTAPDDDQGAADLLARQHEVLDLLARGASLEDTLAAVTRLAEGGRTSDDRQDKDDRRAAVTLVGDDGEVQLGAAPRLPRGFTDRVGGRLLAEATGPDAVAARTGEPVESDDLSVDPRFPEWHEPAGEAGLYGVRAVPIASARTASVLGTLSVYGTGGPGRVMTDPRAEQLALALAGVVIERSGEETSLAYRAMHDPLTGAVNRLVLSDRLELALARSRRTGMRVAVLFCDLDGFKVVNDRWGHDQGDTVLVEVARRIGEVVRPSDTVARFGGDEFVVLCEDVDGEAHALQIADRVSAAVASRPMRLVDTEVGLTASVGVALSAGDEDSAAALIRDADRAMYRAKGRGRGRRALFHDGPREPGHQREVLAEELRGALDREELELHYQPVIDLDEGRVTATEALVRWRHPERGLLLPRDFMGVAEATGLIVPIGAWVLEQAATQLAQWVAADPRLEGLRMHVNLSARQLAEPGMADAFRASVAAVGVDPGSICLEITESVLTDDSPVTVEAVRALSGAGARLALDNFGADYASLTYLRRVPLQLLKVDPRFVDRLAAGSDDLALVHAIVDLAHALEIEAVAEGVETDEQLRLLTGLGCDGAQGHRLSPPRPPAELTASLTFGRTGA